MAASDTPLTNLIELNYVSSHTTFEVGGLAGQILGEVAGATYTDDSPANSSSRVTELHESRGSHPGTLTVDGSVYAINLIVPSHRGTDDVGYTLDDGTTGALSGDSQSSQVVFIEARIDEVSPPRYFALFDETVDASRITSLTTGETKWWWDIDGDHVRLDTPVCFVAGTRIATPEGSCPVEYLRPGDEVMTLDNGAQHLLWSGGFHLSAESLARQPHLRPVVIRRGALGNGLPERDLRVSPQHRIMLRSRIAGRIFGTEEVLVPAVHLRQMPGIGQPRAGGDVHYFHFLCSRHEIVLAEGVPAESLLRGGEALKSLRAAARPVPPLLLPAARHPARPIHQRRSHLAELFRRHERNGQPLLQLPAE